MYYQVTAYREEKFKKKYVNMNCLTKLFDDVFKSLEKVKNKNLSRIQILQKNS